MDFFIQIKSINNPYKVGENQQLGLFDDFIELRKCL